MRQITEAPQRAALECVSVKTLEHMAGLVAPTDMSASIDEAKRV